jgi:serine phosphatase RsbU (regulator of sigma subunit)
LKLSINKRIFLGILLLIIVYSITGYVSFQNLIKSKELTARNSQVIQPSIILLNDLELMIVSSRNYSSSWLTNDITDHPEKEKLIKIHTSEYPALQSKLKLISEKWKEGITKSEIQNVITSFDTIIILQKKIMSSLNNMAAYQDFLLRIEVEGNYLEEVNVKTNELLSRQHQLMKNLKQLSEEEEKIVVQSFSSIKNTNILLTVLSIIISLIIAFTIYRLLKTEQQKTKITEERNLSQLQRAILAEKNKEITDSINYAKRIQQSILPSFDLIKKHCPNHFVFYKPRDIVSGDFYWFKAINENNLLIAAADCTGHGVPGAFVSFVCNSSLNSAISEFGVSDPSKILDKVSELVQASFSQYGEADVKDGMDIALCSLIRTESGARLTYAGANNPICIIKNKELVITEATKKPIGVSRLTDSFISHTIELSKGDIFYLFTDGFMDQFGGPKNKKYKSRNFYNLLHKISSESLDLQKNLLQKELQIWTGTNFQVDDVLVIGIQV